MQGPIRKNDKDTDQSDLITQCILFKVVLRCISPIEALLPFLEGCVELFCQNNCRIHFFSDVFLIVKTSSSKLSSALGAKSR
jgi:hypothetical protein